MGEKEQIEKAMKANLAKVPVHLWNDQIASYLGWELGEVAGMALDVLRVLMLQGWKWRVTVGFCT